MTRRTFVNGSLAAQLAGGPWSLIFEERFTPGFDARWIREGEASYEPRTEAGRRFLRIATRQSPVVKQMHQSVFWRRERLEGDLRFVFRARAEKGNGTIFYMNARTTPGSAYKTIFEWPKPDSREERYSASPDFEAYTFG